MTRASRMLLTAFVALALTTSASRANDTSPGLTSATRDLVDAIGRLRVAAEPGRNLKDENQERALRQLAELDRAAGDLLARLERPPADEGAVKTGMDKLRVAWLRMLEQRADLRGGDGVQRAFDGVDRAMRRLAEPEPSRPPGPPLVLPPHTRLAVVLGAGVCSNDLSDERLRPIEATLAEDSAASGRVLAPRGAAVRLMARSVDADDNRAGLIGLRLVPRAIKLGEDWRDIDASAVRVAVDGGRVTLREDWRAPGAEAPSLDRATVKDGKLCLPAGTRIDFASAGKALPQVVPAGTVVSVRFGEGMCSNKMPMDSSRDIHLELAEALSVAGVVALGKGSMLGVAALSADRALQRDSKASLALKLRGMKDDDGWHEVKTSPIAFASDGREVWSVVDGRKRPLSGGRPATLPQFRDGGICFPSGYRFEFTLSANAELAPPR